MGRFCLPDKLIVEDQDGDTWKLISPLCYHSEVAQKVITAEKGFVTDLASIPRGLWNIIPRTGKYDRAAVIHDVLYKNNGVTRKIADDVLYEAMVTCGVGAFQRRLIYWGVRSGGWVPWNKYRKNS